MAPGLPSAARACRVSGCVPHSARRGSYRGEARLPCRPAGPRALDSAPSPPESWQRTLRPRTTRKCLGSHHRLPARGLTSRSASWASRDLSCGGSTFHGQTQRPRHTGAGHMTALGQRWATEPVGPHRLPDQAGHRVPWKEGSRASDPGGEAGFWPCESAGWPEPVGLTPRSLEGHWQDRPQRK